MTIHIENSPGRTIALEAGDDALAQVARVAGDVRRTEFSNIVHDENATRQEAASASSVQSDWTACCGVSAWSKRQSQSIGLLGVVEIETNP